MKLRLVPTTLLLLLIVGLAGAQNPVTRYGFIGQGAYEMANAWNYSTQLFVSIGNHAPGTTNIQNLTPESDVEHGWGYKNFRRIAVFDARNDGLGYSAERAYADLMSYSESLASYLAWPFWRTRPGFTWWKPNIPALIAADAPQIIAAIRRDLAAGEFRTYWEIGNEPNLFPNLDPADYAKLYSAYFKLIRQHDPRAIILCGGLFMNELMASRDGVLTMFGRSLDGKVTAGVAANPFTLPLNYLINWYTSDVLTRTQRDVKNMLLDRFWRYPSGAAYMRAVIEYWRVNDREMLTPFFYGQFDGEMDVYPGNPVSVHVYPLDDVNYTMTPDQVYQMVRSAFRHYSDSLYMTEGGRKLFAGNKNPIWVTEVGNMNPNMTATQVAHRFDRVLQLGQENNHTGEVTDPGFGKYFAPAVWIWYKPIGVDEKIKRFAPNVTPPYTRLIEDAQRSTPPPNTSVRCDEFGVVGRMLWRKVQNGNEWQYTCRAW